MIGFCDSSIVVISFSVFTQVIEGQSVTRKKLHEKVTASINLLKWKGLVPNDRVLMTIEPSVDFYAAVIAILAIGIYAR